MLSTLIPPFTPPPRRETEAEHARRGDFVRAFPREDDPDRNHDLFDTPRYENELVRAWLHHKRGLLMRYGTVDPRELPRGHPDRVATRRAIGEVLCTSGDERGVAMCRALGEGCVHWVEMC